MGGHCGACSCRRNFGSGASLLATPTSPHIPDPSALFSPALVWWTTGNRLTNRRVSILTSSPPDASPPLGEKLELSVSACSTHREPGARLQPRRSPSPGPPRRRTPPPLHPSGASHGLPPLPLAWQGGHLGNRYRYGQSIRAYLSSRPSRRRRRHLDQMQHLFARKRRARRKVAPARKQICPETRRFRTSPVTSLGTPTLKLLCSYSKRIGWVMLGCTAVRSSRRSDSLATASQSTVLVLLRGTIVNRTKYC